MQNGFLSRRLLPDCPLGIVSQEGDHTHIYPQTVCGSWDQRDPEHLSLEKLQEGRQERHQRRKGWWEYPEAGAVDGFTGFSRSHPGRGKATRELAWSSPADRQGSVAYPYTWGEEGKCLHRCQDGEQALESDTILGNGRSQPGTDWAHISTTLKNRALDMSGQVMAKGD